MLLALALAGCGGRTIRIDIVPTEEELQQVVIESSGADAFTKDKVAMITVSGMIINAKSSGILSNRPNPVSDFREALDAAAKDPSVKAVLLRINSPGGTVTASAMMYNDLLNFKKKTGKPVVTCMMDLCASGGYYLSCASDYRIAYPTTITGSIGVIMETVNINGTLKKIGVATEAVKSAQNKDMGSPFKPIAGDMDKPLSENDRALLQGIIDEYYAEFKNVVKASPHKIKDADWGTVTDGRVVTGKDAARLGLIDQTGDLDAAIAKAKSMAGISKARVIVYSRSESGKSTIYANSQTPAANQTVNMLNLNVDLGTMLQQREPQFLYQWTGPSGE
jgi:protease-4